MKQPIAAEDYADFMRRIRAGDEQAAADLVRLFEPEIRLEVRTWLRLRDPRLRRLFDSMDICQSVLASFFVRAAVGDFDLDKPEQLAGLLAGIARHKLSEHVKHHQRQRRDVRRLDATAAAEDLVVSAAETPSQRVAGRELLDEFRKRLSEEEKRLVDLRTQGNDWAAIAAQLGGSPEARRKQLARAVERIERELGLVTDSAE
jgi:RNA polymerase sigma-70 factor (ECF subfamily)